MGRPERALDPTAGPVQRLAHELRGLRDSAGRPSYRTMAKAAHYSVTALAEAAGGERLPSLAVTLAYVAACGGDRAAWEKRWREAEAELAGGSVGGDFAAPYLGLAAYGPEDVDRYFGRERLVEHVVHRVTGTPVVAVFGASGSGKSSLIRAGLLPASRSHPAFSGHEWSWILLTPTQSPLQELAYAVAGWGGREPDYGEPGWLDRTLRLADPSGDKRVLLVVDQFEELFTLCPDPAERAGFIDELLDAALGAERVATVVLGIRADFYGHCATHPGLAEVLGQGAQVLVGPMTKDELRSAITQPALRAGLTVERDLIATLLADIAGEPGGLPLLSHALLETWRRRRGNMLTQTGYHASGGAHGALAQTAERTYADFDDAERDAARRVFLRLTALGDGTEDTRRRAAHTELATVADQATVVGVLNRLATARLVVIGEESVEVAHEALIRAWPRLRRWLTDDRDGLMLHRRLTDATQVWQSADRDPDLLYRAAQLDQVTAWADLPDHAAALNADEREFLDEAIRLRDKQIRARKRRALRIRLATAVVVVLLAAATVITVIQRNDAREAHRVAVARQLVAEATALREVDPLRAAQLSLASWRIAPDLPATRNSLISTQAVALPTRIPGHSGEVRDVAFSPDGQVMATVADKGTVRMWDAAAHEPLGPPLTGHTDMVNGAAFSPDGSMLVTASTDQTLRLWDVAGRRGVGEPLTGHTGVVTGVAFSPDGRLVVSGSADGTLRVWDAATRLAVGKPLTGHDGPITAVAISPDGSMVASSGNDKTVRLWDLATRRPIGRPLTGHTSVTYGVAFSPDGRTLASSGWDKTVRLWDVATRRPLGTPLTGSTSSVFNISFSPDGSALGGGDSDGSLLIWRLRTTLLPGHTDAVYAVAYSTVGVVGTASDDRTVRLWGISDNQPLGAPLTGHTAEVRAMAFGPRGKLLVTGSWDGTLRLWDTASRKQLGAPLTGHTGWVRGVAISPDGALIATAGMDTTVRLWDVAARKQVGTPLTGHTDSVTGVAFSPDGRILATAANDTTVRLWDVATRSPLGEPLTGHASVVRDVAFSPDGATLASVGDDKTVRLWDAKSRTQIAVLTGHTAEVLKVAFSPDGQELASTGLDKTVHLWDIRSRSATVTFTASTGLAGVAYVPGGLLTGGVTGNVLRWITNVEHAAAYVCTATKADLTDEEWRRHVPSWPNQPLCH
ncbi:WD40 repeat domain-containing protein [Nonomuraea basaltis]|uniref:WD40 repeat domain-containing protein n=1 Tax=Nonomuraea basaltis TaxID=2495887 RepID=UPI0019803231|nr:WD40 repeat domain-containing protein [Nonomuraea basaltis]